MSGRSYSQTAPTGCRLGDGEAMGMKTSVIKNLNPAPTFSWQGGIAGTPWEDGTSVNAQHNSIIMVGISDGDSMQINLPAITPASAGKSIYVRNVMFKALSPGQIVLVADDDDTIESFSPLDSAVYPLAAQELDGIITVLDPDASPDPQPTGISDTQAPNGIHFQLESDGVSNWSFILPNSGLNFLFPI